MIPNLVAGGNRYRRLFYCYPLSSARLWECWCRPPSAAQPRTRCDSPLPETAAVQRRICPVVAACVAEGRQIFRVDTFGEEKEFQPPTLAACFRIEPLRREENHACEVAQECSILDIFFQAAEFILLSHKEGAL